MRMRVSRLLIVNGPSAPEFCSQVPERGACVCFTDANGGAQFIRAKTRAPFLSRSFADENDIYALARY